MFRYHSSPFVMVSLVLVLSLAVLTESNEANTFQDEPAPSSDISDIPILNRPQSNVSRYNKIEGRVIVPGELPLTKDWHVVTRILVNHGEYLGFLKADGSFEVNNLPPGSYLVDVTNPNYLFEPVRVDITSKGKMRARKVNYIQTSAVIQLPYPLRFKPKTPFKYFQTRENWKVTDFLFNPMVLMMVLPMLLILVVPKMVNVDTDGQSQKENQLPQMPQYDMPELSEMMTSLFNAGGSKDASDQIKNAKKKN